MNQVRLICRPSADYNTFKSVSRQTLGLAAPDQHDDLFAAIRLLGEWDALGASHFHFSFLFCSTNKHLTESINHTNLNHILRERSDGFWLAYVTGSLEQWRQAVVHCTQEDKSLSLRAIYTQVYDQLRNYLPTNIRSEMKRLT